jgi:hypothetical protein
MKFSETFNQHKLNYVIQNQERYEIKVYDDYNPYSMPQKYLLRSQGGLKKVSYHQPGFQNLGRFFANDSLSLQSMCREIRHTISSEFYDDLDVVNAHPVILHHLAQKHGLECDRLGDYIRNRDKHLEEMEGVENPKEVFLSLINGGTKAYESIDKPTRFLKKFKREMEDLLEDLVAKYPKEYEQRKKSHPENPIGSTTNVIMCECENKILQCILKFYQTKGIITDNCVLCFDGIMIPKHKETAGLIEDCEAYILEKTNFSVKLKMKAMDSGFDLPDEIPPYVEHKSFDPKDPFCWLEFDSKWRGKTFTSLNEVVEQTRADLNRVICRVEQGSGFIVKKTDCGDNLFDILDRTANFSDIYFKYYDDEKTKELNFKRYIQLFSNDMNRYRSIDFAPNSNDPLLFNLWSGFVAHMCEEDESIGLILNHIREVYCDDCEVSYEYFLDLLYFILKHPEKPPGVATFIYSKKQGSGKNVILDFLQQFVFGNPITHYTTGLEGVLEKHNHLLKSKKIVVVDELASSSDNFVGNFDKLKSMMTGNSLVINPKGTNQYSIKNVLAWFLISNHDDCLRLEQSDRRYFCLRVSEKYVGDKAYFKRLTDTFNEHTGNVFYSYIMNRGDNRPDINIRIPPVNAFKQEVISRSWSSSVRYLAELKEEEHDEPEVSASKMYENYKFWCNTNSERVKSNTKFALDIKTYITRTRKRTGTVYDLNSISI